MFEYLTKSVSHMVSLIWKFSRGGWRTAFLQATQNGAQTAIVFARQSKMHILKSSGFWFYNIITHWGHPERGVQKSNQNWNMEAKNSESNQTVVIAINRYLQAVTIISTSFMGAFMFVNGVDYYLENCRALYYTVNILHGKKTII